MTKLTETQTIILSAGAQRPDNIALPLPKGLAGAAAKMAVNRMIALGWLQEVDANLRRNEPLWRETGDGHGTTLVVTDAGLLAIGIEPVEANTARMGALRTQTEEPASCTTTESSPAPMPHTLREGTKQSTLIAMLRAPEGATMEAIIAATGWQAHSARGAMSGALKKRLGLNVTSETEDQRGRVYRIKDADRAQA
ncbi:DUF3489 domain-containing protein [Rhodobacter ferrooxidans]|uniref:DUF3489 domain-containing protein n=1 Tax=Rhodobacter ferrooxidans TaxID=371731 RepID=C8S3Q1_9RHOB|nr:DUF3489 domain-containing protein [Rhodobacter sp. SW2]EEW24383.1 conserved hypothetical protein [Rhodobacter sp. SW2]